MKYRFSVNGLDCANCAAKLEEDIRKQKEITSVSIDFLQSKAVVETQLEEAACLELLNKRAAVVEPEAVFSLRNGETAHHGHHHEHEHEHEHSHGHDHHSHDHGHHHGHDHGHHHEEEEEEGNAVLWRILASAALLAISQFLLKDPWKTVLSLTAYLIAGYDVILAAVHNILHGQIFDEQFLMTIATLGAAAIKEYPEAAGVMIFYQLGEFLQDKAVDKSRKSIAELMDIRPDIAHRKYAEKTEDVHPSLLEVGDILEIRPGEKIPVDCEVLSGNADIDNSALTGESRHLKAKAGDMLVSGGVCLDSVLEAKVLKPFSQSTASKILELVENASEAKADNEKFITRFSRIYTPVVVIMAFIIGIAVPLITKGKLEYQAAYNALVFLMVSCPCALVISIPLAYFGGIGGLSANGIIVKGGDHLENMAKTDTFVFDKTGTLTNGTFGVSDCVAVDQKHEELLEKAAYAEAYSAHPIGKSVVDRYGKKINMSLVSEVEEIANKGIKAIVNNEEILVGSRSFLTSRNISFPEINSEESVICVAVNGNYAGYLTLSDMIKVGSREAVLELKKRGIQEIVMLTGDEKPIAEKIAAELEITKVLARLLPQDKVKEVEKLNAEGRHVAFVGDGINDAPVLKTAETGISMGAIASDAAMEAADIVLMDDDLRKLPILLDKAKKTERIVKENIVLAIGIKMLVLLLSLFGISNMWAATAADVGVALICVANSLRLLK